ncbi:hypothetical protein [Salinarchaeum laminariae]|uniref:hypothetical protein n=1 Tax=Salinarchaeum laminariae TaxID=869888 RepID=UPI0020C0A080|nr:hypothetical protein [Salinarchaeum laminariae]
MCDSRIEHVQVLYDGREHKVSIIYLPGEEYSLFTVNGWVDSDKANALTKQYRQRWTIENEYKTIKANFLLQTATKDSRIRFLYFVIGVILYYVWRLANFVLREECMWASARTRRLSGENRRTDWVLSVRPRRLSWMQFRARSHSGERLR